MSGLSSPNAFVYAIGAIETSGGILLILGLGTRVVALVMAGKLESAGLTPEGSE